MNAVANKMILVIVSLSALIAMGSFFLFSSLAKHDEVTPFATCLGTFMEPTKPRDAIPFAVGVSFAMFLNISKVLLMKRMVNNALTRDENDAKMYMKGQYFLRLVLTAIILIIVGTLHSNDIDAGVNPQYVNFMGTFYGIFTFPVSVYSMRIFFRKALTDNPDLYVKCEESGNGVQDAIDKLNSLVDKDLLEDVDISKLGEEVE